MNESERASTSVWESRRDRGTEKEKRGGGGTEGEGGQVHRTEMKACVWLAATHLSWMKFLDNDKGMHVPGSCTPQNSVSATELSFSLRLSTRAPASLVGLVPLTTKKRGSCLMVCLRLPTRPAPPARPAAAARRSSRRTGADPTGRMRVRQGADRLRPPSLHWLPA